MQFGDYVRGRLLLAAPRTINDKTARTPNKKELRANIHIRTWPLGHGMLANYADLLSQQAALNFRLEFPPDLHTVLSLFVPSMRWYPTNKQTGQ
jgi:hypothetical protein